MLTDFQNSCTNRISGKFSIRKCIKIATFLEYFSLKRLEKSDLKITSFPCMQVKRKKINALKSCLAEVHASVAELS